jgi:hypothetical protein
LGWDGIDANAQDLGVGFLELAYQILEALKLVRSAAGEG